MLAHKFALEKEAAAPKLPVRGRSRDLKKIVSSTISPSRSRRPHDLVQEEVRALCAVFVCVG